MGEYLRYPHVHGEEITFVADNDIWLADIWGGRASRLTSDRAPVKSPFFSPDGRSIAFASSVDGGWDLHVHSSSGVRRLTWLSDRLLRVAGWLDNEHIAITAEYGSAHRSIAYLYSVSLDAQLTRLPYGPAMGVALGPDKAVAINTPNFRDAAAWKRYRGGMAAQIWLDPNGTGAWKQVLPQENAGLYDPAWIDGRLIFWSDLGAKLPGKPREQAQLYSVGPDGINLRQHTKHTFSEGYVRNPTTDGSTIVYHSRGRIYRMRGLNARPEMVYLDLKLGAPKPVFVSSGSRLNSVVPDVSGDGSLIEWRGAAYFLTHRSGPARVLADQPGVRIREPQMLGRSGRAIWATDLEGEDALEIMPLDAGADPIRIGAGKLGRVLHLASNPEGTQVGVSCHDGRVLVVTISSGTIRQVGRSTEGEPTGLAWSPDGRYLVWRGAVEAEGVVGQLMCVDLKSRRPAAVALTKGQFNDFSPAFSADGKYLMFLSDRTLDPSYDDHSFDLGFRGSTRPWLVPLAADEPAPFGPSADGWAISSEPTKSDPGDESADEQGTKADQVSCQLDVEGFEERALCFPVQAGVYRSLAAAKDGVVWAHGTLTGVLGSASAGASTEPPRDVVEYFGFTNRKLTAVTAGMDSFAICGDGTRIVVRAGTQIWVQPANSIPGKDSDEKVMIDLTRLRRQISPRDEWRQMFNENGRLMADHFWREDLGGVDWKKVLSTYRPLVENLATHDDLVDLLWETVGELNTSHAYVIAPSDSGGNRVGQLGASFERNSKGEFVVKEVLPGESSDPDARSPLRAAGVGVRPGDVILAVDGHLASGAPALGALLVGSAEKVVELTVVQRRMKRRVGVVPIANEKALRYHQWVNSRVKYVDDHSNGRLGYIHIPNMVSEGWAEFHRLVNQATRKEGVIVDVRFNGGGHISELVLERLSRKVLGWGWARHMDTPMSYPSRAPRGPVVLVANPYTGSDGDIITAAVQNAGLGPVVGQRTWGGVVGIDGRYDLVDGTQVTQPRYPFFFNKQGFSVENHGVDPDIVVPWGPKEWESERDSQLDVAIDEAIRRLKKNPAASPPIFEKPKFS